MAKPSSTNYPYRFLLPGPLSSGPGKTTNYLSLYAENLIGSAASQHVIVIYPANKIAGSAHWSARSRKTFWWLWRWGPPLPIPNREVKPTSADGTAVIRGRVSRRQIFIIIPLNSGIFFCLHFIERFGELRLSYFLNWYSYLDRRITHSGTRKLRNYIWIYGERISAMKWQNVKTGFITHYAPSEKGEI